MEINNSMSSTSFGMAFRKPAPEQMVDFTNYVTKGIKSRHVKHVKRGLKQLQKQQESNPHFDIEYLNEPGRGYNHTFFVKPTSEKAKSMYETSRIEKGQGEDSFRKSVLDQLNREAQLLEDKSVGKFKKGLFILKCLYKTAGTILHTYKHPVEVLPKNLRYANKIATEKARAVEAQIAKEKIISDSLK